MTALWKRVGKTEITVPHRLGYTLDEEVYLLACSVAAQTYENAALELESKRDIGHEVCAVMFAARIRALKRPLEFAEVASSVPR